MSNLPAWMTSGNGTADDGNEQTATAAVATTDTSEEGGRKERDKIRQERKREREHLILQRTKVIPIFSIFDALSQFPLKQR